ncbi:hypothetical protein EZV77_24220 [Burkholderia thailandensis]|nr:hypothetical protein A8H32_18420 [Burkholderia thailandensis]MDD1483647.1 hypothetical protein [Burkholderia thailandensis]MDD1489775.1 hypothetical protein [Burkholderia thailandensis]MDD1495849.1 hypothetical protein [Burkholderia thailandensis]PJO69710.1 hypothetical protein CWD92_25115 [Burkholderia thailandensis]
MENECRLESNARPVTFRRDISSAAIRHFRFRDSSAGREKLRQATPRRHDGRLQERAKRTRARTSGGAPHAHARSARVRVTNRRTSCTPGRPNIRPDTCWSRISP